MFSKLVNFSLANKNHLQSLLFLQFFVIISVYFQYGVRTNPDSNSMSIALNVFYGSYTPADDSLWAGHDVFSRYLRPLGLWFAYPIKSLGNYEAFALIGIFFQLLMIPLFYFFSYLITSDESISFYSVICFILSPQTMYHTSRALVDMATWSLFLFTLIYSVLEIRNKQINHSKLMLISFMCGFCSLMKEHAGSSIIFINLMYFFTIDYQNTYYRNIHRILTNTFLFSVPIIVNSFIVFQIYEYTILDWLVFSRDNYGSDGVIEILASVKNSFGLFILPFLYYYRNEILKNNELNILLFSSLFLFLISVKVGRFLFLASPIIIPLSVLGIERFLADFKVENNRRIFYMFSILIIILIFNHLVFLDNYEFLTG